MQPQRVHRHRYAGALEAADFDEVQRRLAHVIPRAQRADGVALEKQAGGEDARGVLIAAISRQRAACVDGCTRPVLPQRVEARKLAPAGRLAGTPRGCFLEQPAGVGSLTAIGEADGLVHSRPARTRCRRRRW